MAPLLLQGHTCIFGLKYWKLAENIHIQRVFGRHVGYHVCMVKDLSIHKYKGLKKLNPV